MSSTKNIGDIIFWNGTIGFIKSEHFGNSIFFHRSNTHAKYNNILLLDKVQYNIVSIKQGKYAGKLKATSIRLVSRGDYSRYERIIGKLRDWNGYFGYLQSEQIDKPVIFYRTRLVTKNIKLSNGDQLVFSPIRSIKNQNELFVLFAYPLEKEEDIVFLEKQLSSNNRNQIKQIIKQVIRSQNNKTIAERFKTELTLIYNYSTDDVYVRTSELIEDYKQAFGFIPSLSLLKEYVKESHIILLWESRKIELYDLEIMKHYFHNSPAEYKKLIIERFSSDDKIKILRYHFSTLIGSNKNEKRYFKPLLDILFESIEDEEIKLRSEIVEHLINELNPGELISLWLEGYVENLSEEFIVRNIDKIESTSTRSKKKNVVAQLDSIYINYFSQLINNNEIEIDCSILALQLMNVKELCSPGCYDSIIKLLNKLSDYQKFFLWIFDIQIFDGVKYFEDNWKNLDSYLQLKYLIKDDIKVNESLQEKLDQISNEKLVQFARDFQWDKLILPIRIDNSSPSFIGDIELFVSKYGANSIDIFQIANEIYDSIEKYHVHHLRLWLYGYVHSEKFSYTGYRQKFKELSYYEKKFFRDRGNDFSKEEIFAEELISIEPCIIFDIEDEITRVYSAHLGNMYFTDSGIQLCTEDKEMTNVFADEFSSSALNRIPKSTEFNNFKVTVRGMDILRIEGLDEFITKVKSNYIEKALAKNTSTTSKTTSNQSSYVEDWHLRKRIIEYLNEFEHHPFPRKVIYEPKNRYRKLDTNTPIEFYEVTYLYTIPTNDGYGIVWENIDLSENRATYVFKATPDTYQKQIEKISNAITSYGQFRSALTKKNNNNDDQLELFKNNYGFISKILKNRGNKLSFERWKDKLDELLSSTIPILPDNEELKFLEDWTIKSSFSPASKVKKIKEKDIMIMDIPGNNIPINNSDAIEILDSLKRINQLFIF